MLTSSQNLSSACAVMALIRQMLPSSRTKFSAKMFDLSPRSPGILLRPNTPTSQRVRLEHSHTGFDGSNGSYDWGSISGAFFRFGGALALLWGGFKHLNEKERERQEGKIRLELDFVNDQIKHLYGPLYGNRLHQSTTFEGAKGEYKTLPKYLEGAKKDNNKKMIDNWRKFVWEILFPLDEKARDLICQNRHLVEGKFPEEFSKFLRHFGKLEYVVSRWKDEDGRLKKANGDFLEEDFSERNNASTECGLDSVLEYAEQKLSFLNQRKQHLLEKLFDYKR